MPLPSLYDRVQEESGTIGTGNLTLDGAVTGFISFSSRLSIGEQFYYCIDYTSADQWEVGIGTLSSSSILVRDTVLSSSNSDDFVSFSIGQKKVFLTVPASIIIPDKNYTHTQSSSSATWTINHGLNKKPAVSIIDSAKLNSLCLSGGGGGGSVGTANTNVAGGDITGAGNWLPTISGGTAGGGVGNPGLTNNKPFFGCGGSGGGTNGASGTGGAGGIGGIGSGGGGGGAGVTGGAGGNGGPGIAIILWW